jgi:hypothetical protein
VKSRYLPLCLLLATAVVTAGAQSDEPAAPPTSAAAPAPTPTPTPKGRLPEAKRTDKTGKYGKTVTPDPDLLDGSSFEKEKRPLHGMLSEIEMGEEEGGKNDKISPDSGPAGSKPAPDDKTPPPKNAGAAAASAAAEPPKDDQAGGGTETKVPEGPAAGAEGAQAANLKAPEGAAGGGPGANSNQPRDQQIGDASLQIQTAPQNAANVVGMQASTSQQYDKKTPSGGSQQSSNGNTGVEKGRVVPKGL